jgi:hypothetical protein
MSSNPSSSSVSTPSSTASIEELSTELQAIPNQTGTAIAQLNNLNNQLAINLLAATGDLKAAANNNSNNSTSNNSSSESNNSPSNSSSWRYGNILQLLLQDIRCLLNSSVATSGENIKQLVIQFQSHQYQIQIHDNLLCIIKTTVQH